MRKSDYLGDLMCRFRFKRFFIHEFVSQKCEMNFEYIQKAIRIENFQQTITILDRILNFFQLARSAVEFS